MIYIYEVGARVTLGDDVPAVITAVLIHKERIQYKCSWWNGRSRNEEWFDPFEVKYKDDAKRMAIGFMTNGEKDSELGT